jgi:hypothetical protein
VVSVVVGVGTLKGEGGIEGIVGLDRITALLRATGELGGLVKMEKRSSKLEVEKDSTGLIWLSPSPYPTVPCTSPTCPRVGALGHFVECGCRLKKGMLQCPQSLRPKEVRVGSEISPSPVRWRCTWSRNFCAELQDFAQDWTGQVPACHFFVCGYIQV